MVSTMPQIVFEIETVEVEGSYPEHSYEAYIIDAKSKLTALAILATRLDSSQIAAFKKVITKGKVVTKATEDGPFERAKIQYQCKSIIL